jgi:hypothetical protein
MNNMSKLTRFGNKLLFGVKKNKNTIELVVGIGAVIAGSTLLVKNASKIVDANDEQIAIASLHSLVFV